MNVSFQNKSSEVFKKYYRPLEPILQKPKNRMYTTTVLSFLTVSLFIWYAIRPTIQTILSLRREIRDSTAVNEQMETKISALVESQAVYQNVVPRLGLIKEAVPETPEMVALLVQLRNLAHDVDATVSAASIATVPLTAEKIKQAALPTPMPTASLAPAPAGSTGAKPSAANPDSTTTPLTITIQGSYDSIKLFIQGLYSMRRIVTITDMSLIPHTSELGSIRGGSLTMTLKLNAYSAGTE